MKNNHNSILTLNSNSFIFDSHHSQAIMASTTTISSSIISGEPLPITNIMDKVVEMKNICVDGVALSGMVMESLGEKFDRMHHNLKRKTTDQINEIR